jgi:prolyl oligopeptidase
MAESYRAPLTEVRPVTELVHGVEITDPYRWLEDGESEEVRGWTEAQNAYTRRWLEARPELPELRRRILEMMQTGFVQPPVKRGERYFFTARQGSQNQAVLYVREGSNDRILIDPATLSEDGTTALDWWEPSPDGALVAYGLSEGGTELSTLYILDVTTGETFEEKIPYTRFCTVAWLPDNSGFYYTRYPEPGTVPPGQERYNRKVFYHKRGDNWRDDRLIYSDPDPQGMPGCSLHLGRYLLVEVAFGWSRIEMYWANLDQPEFKLEKLTGDIDALFQSVVAGDTLYLITNWQAPRFRVLRAPLATPQQENWQEVIPEGEHTLQNLKVAGKHLVGVYLENAISKVRLFNPDGNPQGEVPLPALGTVYGPLENQEEDDEILLSFTSFAYPVTAYRYLPESGKLEIFKAPAVPSGFDPASVEVKQVWYKSKDGTPISMFVVHKAGLEIDGKRPTWLTGYGGFSISRTAEYGTGALRMWLERGGVYALPNLRGGGEYGEDWHTAGKLGNKQNVFDDFYAAAEWLIQNGYTSTEKLACLGGSNGGLLVGAAITQRPDLFRAAVCSVPLLDMVRYQHFLVARLWIPEYGSSEDPEQFKWLYAYSPYHHVKEGQHYPAILFTTGEGDSRVEPLHARKMAALMQAKADPSRPVLIRVETKAGHGQGKPVTKLAEEQADIWAFLLWQLGESEG